MAERAVAARAARRLVVDTDTASDDAVALMLAAAADVELVAVTVVAGNVELETAVRNALVTLDLCGCSAVPVHAGAARPLTRSLETSEDTHGASGMSGVALPEPSRSATSDDAVDVLRRSASTSTTLVTLGPLTNVANALAADPLLLTRYEHTYLMAGSPDGVGNVNVAGEFNVWADPEAATAVLAAPGDKTMVGWNISRQFAVLTPGDDAVLRSTGPLGTWASDINAAVDDYCRRVSGLDGYDLPDPVTMAVALDPTLITDATNEAVVVGLDEPTRGAVLVDRRAERSEPHLRVVWAVDEARFKQRLFDACRTLDSH